MSAQYSEQITISTQRDVHPCQQTYFYAWKTRNSAQGSIVGGDHKIVCECVHGEIMTHWCNKTVIVGHAIGWDSYGQEWVQRGLIGNCPCANLTDGTEHVLEPTGPIVIPPLPAPPIPDGQ